MARKKQRIVQHIMEDVSYSIIEKFIPRSWVIREFNRPDYGIDLVIELFEKVDAEVFETLGEFIFVQTKSVKTLKETKEKIYPVFNVAKHRWKEDRSEYIEIDVVKYAIETNLLFTIQSLGASVSVLLFLVDLENEEVYFICMNDYIDKIILPKSSDYCNQKTYTIKIPVLNKLSNREICEIALEYYGKRAKMLASFSKFYYQKNELDYSLSQHIDNTKELSKEEVELVKYFIEQIENLDIWDYKGWRILPTTKEEINDLKTLLTNSDVDALVVHRKIHEMWHKLTNLGRVYEDICREWYLPKYMNYETATK